jgi:diguanylate cyclase (GGDEF)-like protein
LKEVNDRFGHLGGDAAIRGVAQMIRASCRDFDLAARYGGEEFAVILPETQLAGAIAVAERIRERIRHMDVPGVGRVTASIGVSNYPVNALLKEDLIQAADHALYQAKEGGRDSVSHLTYRIRDRVSAKPNQAVI